MCNPRLGDNRDLKDKKVVDKDSMFISSAVRHNELWDRVVMVRCGNYSDNLNWDVIGSCMRQGIVEAFLLGKEPINLAKGGVVQRFFPERKRSYNEEVTTETVLATFGTSHAIVPRNSGSENVTVACQGRANPPVRKYGFLFHLVITFSFQLRFG
ncbi:hypothetical protein L6452_39810 [Arctium lappa]|uniref:Uncharacterized protein n=1 Tax=Arctium lappa TaxID=4217 RepID=A0ACB8XU66_ARCLA|nr:hypothetical protein L6452_39810 [Arctium lappa]